MPSGNTNIMKEYKEIYREIDCSYRTRFPKLDNYDSFLNNCEGLYELEVKKDEIAKEIETCTRFVEDLELVLRTNQLKDGSVYSQYIINVNKYKDEYEEIYRRILADIQYA